MVTTVDNLTRVDLALAVAVAARAFRDTPSSVSMFGTDPLPRLRALHTTFSVVLPVQSEPPPLVAKLDGGLLVGVAGMNPPGRCIGHTVSRFPADPLPGIDAESYERVRAWIFAWADHDLKEPHWHLGPVGVDPIVQGAGIGSAMLAEFTRRMDLQEGVAWLETDSARNVVLYERFGFRVADETDILGVRNWWMRREPDPITDEAASPSASG